MHGDLPQPMRERIMQGFRDGKIVILVATDVVGRGIDVSGISHIINYDLPDDPENYVHRIGRTGRMGKDGDRHRFRDAGAGRAADGDRDLDQQADPGRPDRGVRGHAPRVKPSKTGGARPSRPRKSLAAAAGSTQTAYSWIHRTKDTKDTKKRQI